MVSAIGSTSAGSSAGTSDISSQIAALQKQMTSIQKQLTKLEKEGSKDTKDQRVLLAKQIAMIQTQITALQNAATQKAAMAQVAREANAVPSVAPMKQAATSAGLGENVDTYA